MLTFLLVVRTLFAQSFVVFKKLSWFISEVICSRIHILKGLGSFAGV